MAVNPQEWEAVRVMQETEGWVIYQNLSERWRQQKSKEQQALLRQCKTEELLKAAMIQSEIDASLYMVGGQTTIISDFKKQFNNPQDEEKPHY